MSVDTGPGAGTGIWLVWLLIVVAIVLVWIGIAAIVLRIAPIGRGRDDSRRLLRERFARGEITQAEYEDAKRILGL